MKKQFMVVRYPEGTQPRVLPENNAVVDNYETALGIINGMLLPVGMPVIQSGREKPVKIKINNETIELIAISRVAD